MTAGRVPGCTADLAHCLKEARGEAIGHIGARDALTLTLTLLNNALERYTNIRLQWCVRGQDLAKVIRLAVLGSRTFQLYRVLLNRNSEVKREG